MEGLVCGRFRARLRWRGDERVAEALEVEGCEWLAIEKETGHGWLLRPAQFAKVLREVHPADGSIRGPDHEQHGVCALAPRIGLPHGREDEDLAADPLVRLHARMARPQHEVDPLPAGLAGVVVELDLAVGP